MGRKKKQRTGYCCINNESSRYVLSLKMTHKYSDVYKDTYHQDPIVVSNPQSVIGSTSVTFNTGRFTTGQDWFHLKWISIDLISGKCYLNETNPKNFRWFFDAAEKLVSLDDLMQKESLGFAPESIVFNIESTVGFKKHCLHKIDSYWSKPTNINITNDKVWFISESGTSNVGYVSKSLNLSLISLLTKIHQMTQSTLNRHQNKSDETIKQYDSFVNQLIKNRLSLVQNDDDLTCCICMDKVCLNTASRHQGVCRSLFHFDCISKWQSGTCPICRVDFSQNNHQLIKIS